MLTTSTRATIAAALSSVAGIAGYPHRPAVVNVGDAWPQVASFDRGPADAWEATWSVWVVLPADEEQAANTTDALLPDLVDALDPVAYVEQVEPVTIIVSGGELLALRIRCRGE